MLTSLLHNLRMTSWPARVAAAALLLVVALAWTVQRQFGVTEIRRADSPRNVPVAIARPCDESWPGVFGPDHNGQCRRSGFPREQSTPHGPDWHLPFPGPANGGPCVWGELIAVPVHDPSTQSISLAAVHRRYGRVEWTTKLHTGVNLHAAAPRGMAAPACDGQSFFVAAVVNGQLLVSAVDLQSRHLWAASAGPMLCENGRLVSPLICGSLVIVSGENPGAWGLGGASSSPLTAFHRLTGEIIWRTARPNGEGLATPVLADVAGRTQLIIPSPGKIAAYNPANGESLWSCRWSAGRVANCVSWNDQLVFATTRDPRPQTIAIRADGDGDVTDTHVVWRNSTVGSTAIPLTVHHRSVIGLNEDGWLTSLEATTGKLQWRRQLSGSFALRPILAGDDLLCVNQDGTAWIVSLAQRGAIVSQRLLVEGVTAPFAPTSQQLFLRNKSDLISLTWENTESPLVNTPRRRL